MATMKEIAKLAKVSTATVSHVLSGKKQVKEATRKRVEDAIEKTNYTLNNIAKSLRMNKTHTIGVLVEDIRGLPVPEIVNGISEQLEQQGYQILLNNLRLLEKLYNQYDHITMYRTIINDGIRVLLDAHVDGIIYVAMHDRRFDGIIDPPGKPLVYAYAHSSVPGDVFSTYNNFDSAKDMTRLLLQKGHRRIGLIAGHAHSFPCKERILGFESAMAEAGVAVQPEYIRWGDWEYRSGEMLCEELLSLPTPPSAIFSLNDLMAAGCLAAIHKRGLCIPEDISLAGFDNRDFASCLYPPLTTIALPNREIGCQSAQMLLTLLNDKDAEVQSQILPCALFVRNSVGTAPKE